MGSRDPPTKDSPGPFNFYALPPEVRLQILESTDLLTPAREVHWDPVTGYKLPSRGDKGAWQSPASLFLVSRDVYARAREIFFRRNRLVLWAHVSAFIGQALPDAPLDYAATTFFAGVLRPESVKCLRHLELPSFALIGAKGKEKVEGARRNWFRALRRAYGDGDGDGDGGGLDNLRFLRISGTWDDAPSRDVFPHDGTTAEQARDCIVVRNFVKEHVWPMIEPEYGPPRLPLQLLVEIQGPQLNLSRYRIRRKGERVYDVNNLAERFGEPGVSRFISWRLRHPGDLKGNWVAEEQDSGEWIEEAWIIKLNRLA
ncbi:hypothetical protein GGR51DRAFT_394235 [Nemania sp. FL0031]|nr:hypothetical protein GGR51DRAFT_394235 [Nemania sp. FL0031]